MRDNVNSNATRHMALTALCGAFAINVKILTGNNDMPGGYTIITVVSSPMQKIRMMKNEVNKASNSSGNVIFRNTYKGDAPIRRAAS
jgi:hypothetical protein